MAKATTARGRVFLRKKTDVVPHVLRGDGLDVVSREAVQRLRGGAPFVTRKLMP